MYLPLQREVWHVLHEVKATYRNYLIRISHIALIFFHNDNLVSLASLVVGNNTNIFNILLFAL